MVVAKQQTGSNSVSPYVIIPITSPGHGASQPRIPTPCYPSFSTMSTVDVSAALNALEALAANNSTSSSGPLNRLLDEHFAVARERLLAGAAPKHVITELQTNIARAKKDVEKGLKAWYSALANVGKSVDKVSC